MSADGGRIARHFDLRAAAATDELPEPVPISARLLDLVIDLCAGRTVLDLGCGTGADAIRLVNGGARSVTGIDLSPASIDLARTRALKAGIRPERASFAIGDVASVPLQVHDWVILDRVICCYGDADQLLSNALSAATRGLAFSVPESRGWRGLFNSISWRTENLWEAICARDACPSSVHDVRMIERRIQATRFSLVDSERSGLWYAAVFAR